MDQTTVLVAGAGPAGLSLAACLQKKGITSLIIEERDMPGGPWREHYDRLHLHTPKSISALPFFSYPPGTPKYPSRDQVVSYLDNYYRHFRIEPLCGTKMLSATRHAGGWSVQTSKGMLSSRFLVIATGKSQVPKAFLRDGIDLFTGRILHSKDYRSGRAFTGKKVLVVGFGNSACEIAMDLFEQGATPVMSVRSPVNIVPRDLFGIPVLYWNSVLSRFPAPVADRLSAPLLRLSLGDYSATGLQKAAYGPSFQVRQMKKIPSIDIGALRYIREKKIRIEADVVSVSGSQVRFINGKAEAFDAIVNATGYETDWPALQGLAMERAADLKKPSVMQAFFSQDAIYSCGFATSGTGMLRAIAKEAMLIAADISLRLKKQN